MNVIEFQRDKQGLIRVHRFQTLGVEFRDFLIHAHDLPSYGVEGLLGMDFLGEFDFEVRISEQRICLVRAGSAQAAGDGASTDRS